MKLIDLIRPYNIEGNLKRFGDSNDGGYVLNCDFLKKTKKMYSYGIGDNFSFERDISNYMEQYHIYLYDQTINLEKNISDKMTFKKEGLSFDKRNDSNNFLNHIKENNDENNNILLKIDIESNEIDFFTKVNMQDFKNVTQMVIEFHLCYLDSKKYYLESVNNYINLHDPESNKIKSIGGFYKKTLDILNKINKYFYCIHIHPNNSVETIIINEDRIPLFFECTFINKKYIDYIPKLVCNKIYPINDLDYNNACNSKRIFIEYKKEDSNCYANKL
jgi:hypothetical protein